MVKNGEMLSLKNNTCLNSITTNHANEHHAIYISFIQQFPHENVFQYAIQNMGKLDMSYAVKQKQKRIKINGIFSIILDQDLDYIKCFLLIYFF